MVNKSYSASKLLLITVIFWGLLTVWFTYIYLFDVSDNMKYAFGATYGLMAIVGAYAGFKASKSWGGIKSKLGRTMFFLSCGLLAAEFGQLVFSYYNIIKGVEIPYPSIADIGFFSNIPLYILALIALAHVTGTKYTLNKQKAKVLILIVPLLVLTASYSIFLKSYDFTDATALRVFLDFGYPLGQAIYVTMALSILLLSFKTLGGVMRKRVMLLLLALMAQYAADFNFLYQTLHETWVNGSYGDYLYLLAYTLMTLALISFISPNVGTTTKKVK